MLLQASAEGSRIEGVGNLIGWGGGSTSNYRLPKSKTKVE